MREMTHAEVNVEERIEGKRATAGEVVIDVGEVEVLAGKAEMLVAAANDWHHTPGVVTNRT